MTMKTSIRVLVQESSGSITEIGNIVEEGDDVDVSDLTKCLCPRQG